jgi:branched-chain amino acid transport system substrate-binding protein
LRVRSLAAMSCLVTVSAFGVAACGSSKKSSGGGGSASAGSSTLTIYSSLPQQASDRVQTTAVINGEKMALEEAGGKAGKFTIKYVSLDDATAAAGQWDPGQTSSNARKAAQDKSTIAYLGEFNSGASAISIPILNEAGIMQISPANTYVGLTRSQGADKGEPDKYYPSGKRTYARVVPADHIQAAAQVTYEKDQGCSKLYVLNDKQVYGKGLADLVASDAKTQGMTVLGNDGIDTNAANFRALAAKIKAKGANCMFFGGIQANKANQVWNDVHAAVPNAKLFGPDGVANSFFSTKLTPSEQKVTFVTNPTLDPKLYPPAAQKFFTDYNAKYHVAPEPYAIYGYTAMKLILDAIRRAGNQGNNRQAVINQVFATKNFSSVLGTFSIDKNGDTTLTDYGGNVVKGGKLVFDKVIKAKVQ